MTTIQEKSRDRDGWPKSDTERSLYSAAFVSAYFTQLRGIREQEARLNSADLERRIRLGEAIEYPIKPAVPEQPEEEKKCEAAIYARIVALDVLCQHRVAVAELGGTMEP